MMSRSYRCMISDGSIACTYSTSGINISGIYPCGCAITSIDIAESGLNEYCLLGGTIAWDIARSFLEAREVQ